MNTKSKAVFFVALSIAFTIAAGELGQPTSCALVSYNGGYRVATTAEGLNNPYRLGTFTRGEEEQKILFLKNHLQFASLMAFVHSVDAQREIQKPEVKQWWSKEPRTCPKPVKKNQKHSKGRKNRAIHQPR